MFVLFPEEADRCSGCSLLLKEGGRASCSSTSDSMHCVRPVVQNSHLCLAKGCNHLRPADGKANGVLSFNCRCKSGMCMMTAVPFYLRPPVGVKVAYEMPGKPLIS